MQTGAQLLLKSMNANNQLSAFKKSTWQKINFAINRKHREQLRDVV
jgi:hypothetical protein